jgi:hypothetical protein
MHDHDLAWPSAGGGGSAGDEVYTGGFLVPQRTRPATQRRPTRTVIEELHRKVAPR